MCNEAHEMPMVMKSNFIQIKSSNTVIYDPLFCYADVKGKPTSYLNPHNFFPMHPSFPSIAHFSFFSLLYSQVTFKEMFLAEPHPDSHIDEKRH